MVGRGSSGGGGEEGFTGRAAIGYDHGYDGEVFYLGLALDEKYIEGFVEGCLKWIDEDNPEEKGLVGVNYKGKAEEAFEEVERLAHRSFCLVAAVTKKPAPPLLGRELMSGPGSQVL